jgi:biotin transport system substrate-specific component
VPIGPTALSSLVFLPGDLLKAGAAVLLAVALRRAYPRAFPTVQTPAPTPVAHAR